MKLIVCIDERGGMAFNNRRQSRDPAVIEDILSSVGDSRLFISPYSAELFPNSRGIKIRKFPHRAAGAYDFCFIEEISPKEFLAQVDEIILYNWNRHYPSDVKFGISPIEHGFSLAEVSEFSGIAHKKITKEVYRK